MILIIGGYAQGKQKYARDNYRDADKRMLFLDGIARESFDKGEDYGEFTSRLLRENADAVIITDETGCGIIPAVKEERLFREWLGRAQCNIAAASDEVIKVTCGLGVKIK